MLLDELITAFGELQACEVDCLAYTGVQFNVDFGPFKAGEEVDNVAFNFEEGTLTEYDDGGQVKRQCKFGLVAK